MKFTIIQGDVLEALRTLPDESVNTIITSPPYWGLRDYGVEGQIGLESTLEEYLDKLLKITAELKRILRKDGVMFWNHGDCYGGGIAHFDFGQYKGEKQFYSKEALSKAQFKGIKKDSGGEYLRKDVDEKRAKTGNFGTMSNNLIAKRYTIGWTDCGCNAGWREGVVLDPFMGSGTTLVVARRLGCSAIGIELNPEYVEMAKKRIRWGLGLDVEFELKKIPQDIEGEKEEILSEVMQA